MNWTTVSLLKTKLQRYWNRGDLLRSLNHEQSLFPLYLTLKKPNANELASRFEAVRNWIAELAAIPQIKLEYNKVNHRILGIQQLPTIARIDFLEDALSLIAKQKETLQFKELFGITSLKQPKLIPWLNEQPLQAIKFYDYWEHLLDVVNWFLQNYRSGIYLRQIDIPGIHTKFIETHRGILALLLDQVLPEEDINTHQSGLNQFTKRYGLLDKPTLLRFRILDKKISLLPIDSSFPIIALDSDSFSTLSAPIERVFITENETNFLAFPPVANSIVIFGAGYGWEALAKANWLKHCCIYYWGDIDTHGFAILNQLRHHFKHVQSFLMDKATLLAHQDFWGTENNPANHDLPFLTNAELQLYDELRDNRICKNLRLEQERIGFRFVEAVLKSLFIKA